MQARTWRTWITLLAVTCLSLPLATTLPLAHAGDGAQDAPQHWLHPQFNTKTGSFHAGTAFLAVVDGKRYVVTAHQLFGPSGGLPRLALPARWQEHAHPARNCRG